MEKTFCYRSWFVRDGIAMTLDHQNESKELAIDHAMQVARYEGMSHIETKRINGALYRTSGAFTRVST